MHSEKPLTTPKEAKILSNIFSFFSFSFQFKGLPFILTLQLFAILLLKCPFFYEITVLVDCR